MLRAISILSVFCRDTSALRSSSYSYLVNKTINYPSHLQQDVLPLSEVSHAGRLVWETLAAVAGSFAIWPTAEQWLGLEPSFLPSLCVSSLTHNRFSLPISSQSQPPFKSPLIAHNFYHHWSLFKFYSFLPSNWTLDAKSIFHHHFQTVLLSFACTSRNQGMVETGSDL